MNARISRQSAMAAILSEYTELDDDACAGRDAPWYRQVTAQQWKTFLTTFTAWTLDSFDFTILTFVLIDIQQSFSVNRALAGRLAR